MEVERSRSILQYLIQKKVHYPAIEGGLKVGLFFNMVMAKG